MSDNKLRSAVQGIALCLNDEKFMKYKLGNCKFFTFEDGAGKIHIHIVILGKSKPYTFWSWLKYNPKYKDYFEFSNTTVNIFDLKDMEKATSNLPSNAVLTWYEVDKENTGMVICKDIFRDKTS